MKRWVARQHGGDQNSENFPTFFVEIIQEKKGFLSPFLPFGGNEGSMEGRLEVRLIAEFPLFLKSVKFEVKNL